MENPPELEQGTKKEEYEGDAIEKIASHMSAIIAALDEQTADLPQEQRLVADLVIYAVLTLVNDVASARITSDQFLQGLVTLIKRDIPTRANLKQERRMDASGFAFTSMIYRDYAEKSPQPLKEILSAVAQGAHYVTTNPDADQQSVRETVEYVVGRITTALHEGIDLDTSNREQGRVDQMHIPYDTDVLTSKGERRRVGDATHDDKKMAEDAENAHQQQMIHEEMRNARNFEARRLRAILSGRKEGRGLVVRRAQSRATRSAAREAENATPIEPTLSTQQAAQYSAMSISEYKRQNREMQELGLFIGPDAEDDTIAEAWRALSPSEQTEAQLRALLNGITADRAATLLLQIGFVPANIAKTKKDYNDLRTSLSPFRDKCIFALDMARAGFRRQIFDVYKQWLSEPAEHRLGYGSRDFHHGFYKEAIVEAMNLLYKETN